MRACSRCAAVEARKPRLCVRKRKRMCTCSGRVHCECESDEMAEGVRWGMRRAEAERGGGERRGEGMKNYGV